MHLSFLQISLKVTNLFGATFVSKFAANNFKKSPSLVTLLPCLFLCQRRRTCQKNWRESGNVDEAKEASRVANTNQLKGRKENDRRRGMKDLLFPGIDRLTPKCLRCLF